MEAPQDQGAAAHAHAARTKKDTVQLTKNLDIPSHEAPGSGAPVWKSASVRKGRLRAAIISTAVFAVVAVGVAVLLAWTTNPWWGGYPRTPATVVGLSEYDTHKSSTICTTTVRFVLDGVTHEAQVKDEGPCDALAGSKEQVTLAYNPSDFSGVLIVGQDARIRTAVSMIGLISPIPLLLLLGLSVMCVRSHRNAKRAATSMAWQEITVFVKDLNSSPEHTNLLLRAADADGADRTFVMGYPTSKMSGLGPQKDGELTLRLVSDGDGHAVLSAPDGSATCDATISTPNSFELRTLGL
ncbi:hypothetical protein [Arthrobacter woluwensis]|uniref:hypothetical protein n=1 Tax=Arthrobacter woluwensis TaxID=156980 RepID=UPI001AAECF22|nr:hypothetical protein [Arthrobacter woluwensis]QTF73418.1 hypothetical protein G8758_16445 [Arthrobacter woluwensis]